MQNHVNLRGMTWDHPRAYDSLIAASRAYARTNDVSIEWEKRSLQDFADVPIIQLARQYDLIILDHPHVGQIAMSGCLSPLQTMPVDVSMGGSIESYEWQGETWAHPIDAACQMSVVRPDLSTAFPKHWEEVLNDDAQRFGLLTPLQPVDAFDMMLTLVASLGEEVLPLNETEFCSEQSGVLALKIIKRLFNLGPSEAVRWNPINVLETLSQTNEFAASPCLFGYINYARPGFRRDVLKYVDLPTFSKFGKRRSILGGAGIGVSSMRENIEMSKNFASWVTSEVVQSGVYLENEGQPAHLNSWNKQQNNAAYAGFLSGGYETMRTAWTRPRDEWFLHFVDDVCEAMPGFFLKDKDETTFLAELNKLYCHHITKVKS